MDTTEITLNIDSDTYTELQDMAEDVELAPEALASAFIAQGVEDNQGNAERALRGLE